MRAGLPSGGCGLIYGFAVGTGAYTVLYNFRGDTDGYAPALGAMDASGDLFGTTSGGGQFGYGTLFELVNNAGSYSFLKLHAFTGGVDGGIPNPPVMTADGKLIGTTQDGPVVGANPGDGTIFEYARGAFTTLYTFTRDGNGIATNGSRPLAAPIVDSAGKIYGNTVHGGVTPCNATNGALIAADGCGVVFSFKQ